MTSFTHLNGQVHLAGSALSDHRIDCLLDFFQARVTEAEKAAHEARRAWLDLEDARCRAVDFRLDRPPADQAPSALAGMEGRS